MLNPLEHLCGLQAFGCARRGTSGCKPFGFSFVATTFMLHCPVDGMTRMIPAFPSEHKTPLRATGLVCSWHQDSQTRCQGFCGVCRRWLIIHVVGSRVTNREGGAAIELSRTKKPTMDNDQNKAITMPKTLYDSSAWSLLARSWLSCR